MVVFTWGLAGKDEYILSYDMRLSDMQISFSTQMGGRGGLAMPPPSKLDSTSLCVVFPTGDPRLETEIYFIEANTLAAYWYHSQ